MGGRKIPGRKIGFPNSCSPSLSMNRRMLSLISNDLQLCGSWPRFTSDFWRCPLPMNRPSSSSSNSVTIQVVNREWTRMDANLWTPHAVGCFQFACIRPFAVDLNSYRLPAHGSQWVCVFMNWGTKPGSSGGEPFYRDTHRRWPVVRLTPMRGRGIPAIFCRSGPPQAGLPGADTTPVLTQQNRPAPCACCELCAR
jgi:hypothetical protein